MIVKPTIKRLSSNLISNGARKLFILVGLAALAYAPHAFAQGFTALAPIPGLTDMSPTSAVNSDTLAAFFNNLYKYLIGIAAALAVIEIIWGGLEYSTQDSVSKQSNGRERITQAIFGLILVLSPVLVFSIINPSILNLSIKLDPLDLYVAPITPATVATSSLPGGGTSYTPVGGTGATGATVGSWCFNVTVRGGNFGPTSEFKCYPDKTGCDSYLAEVRANPTGQNFSVSGGAACIQQVSF